MRIGILFPSLLFSLIFFTKSNGFIDPLLGILNDSYIFNCILDNLQQFKPLSLFSHASGWNYNIKHKHIHQADQWQLGFSGYDV